MLSSFVPPSTTHSQIVFLFGFPMRGNRFFSRICYLVEKHKIFYFCIGFFSRRRPHKTPFPRRLSASPIVPQKFSRYIMYARAMLSEEFAACFPSHRTPRRSGQAPCPSKTVPCCPARRAAQIFSPSCTHEYIADRSPACTYRSPRPSPAGSPLHRLPTHAASFRSRQASFPFPFPQD